MERHFLVSFLCCLCACAVYLTGSEIINYMPKGSSFIQLAWTYQYLHQMVIIIPVIIFGCIKRKHAEGFLEAIYTFDEFIEFLNWEYKVNHSKNKKHLCICLAFIALSITIMYFFSIYTTKELPMTGKIIMLMSIIFKKFHLFVMYQFLFSVMSIKSRYEILNKNMR